MFLHTHPYPPYIPARATKLIVGTLPPPRFTTQNLKPGDVDFCYGSRDGQLWKILDRIFELNLLFETSDEAVQQRKEFLNRHEIGICDIVESARRDKVDASDLGMQQVILRNMLEILVENEHVHTLLFMGGNSKNGPEYFFRRLLKQYDINLEVLSSEVPRIHELSLPKSKRMITTVSLTAPSGAANRAVGSLQQYKELKNKNPEMNTIDFRVLQYKKFF
ncbi:MAG: uracil-DNA glycosylase family protein [Flavobacteriaceae bacterium]|nr:uracil-DNA glycosylase family protein [Flavobacteriaceae bacterium]